MSSALRHTMRLMNNTDRQHLLAQLAHSSSTRRTHRRSSTRQRACQAAPDEFSVVENVVTFVILRLKVTRSEFDDSSLRTIQRLLTLMGRGWLERNTTDRIFRSADDFHRASENACRSDSEFEREGVVGKITLKLLEMMQHDEGQLSLRIREEDLRRRFGLIAHAQSQIISGQKDPVPAVLNKTAM